MPTPVMYKSRSALGAGVWYWAPLGTWTEDYAPAGAASKFTLGTGATAVPGDADAHELGPVRSGSTITLSSESTQLYYENFAVPAYDEVERLPVGFTLDFAKDSLSNFTAAMNGGTWTGTPDADSVSVYTPPGPEDVVHRQWLWVNSAGDDLWLFFEAVRTGEVSINQRRLDYWSYNCTFSLLQPDSEVAAQPYQRYRIGTVAA